MSIPGLDPVSPQEESFTFEIPDDVPADTGPRKSKYEFANGKYPGKVISLVLTKSKTSGKPQFEMALLGTDGPAKGIDYRTWFQLSGAGYPITKQVFKKVFGFDIDTAIKTDENGKKTCTVPQAQVVGKPVLMDLAQDPYTNSAGVEMVRMKCKTLYPPASLPNTAAAASDVPPF